MQEQLLERMMQERHYRMTNCLLGSGKMAYFEAPNQKKSVPDSAKSMHEICQLVRSGQLKDATNNVRNYRKTAIGGSEDWGGGMNDGSERDWAEVKKACTAYKMQHLPCVLPAGYCKRRKDGQMTSWSGWTAIDIDGQDNPHIMDVETIKQLLAADPVHQPALIYTSLSGRGLHAYYPIVLSEEMPYSVWYTYLEKYMLFQYGLQIDMSLLSPMHVLTLCHDENAFVANKLNL